MVVLIATLFVVAKAIRGEVHLISVQSAASKPLKQDTLSPGDFLVMRGKAAHIAELAQAHGITVEVTAGSCVACGLVSKSFGAAEVLVAPRSNLIGTEVYPGMVTESGSLVVLAHQRAGKFPAPPTRAGHVRAIRVHAGDTLLLHGSWQALDKHTLDQNVLLVDCPYAIRRQTVPLGPRAIPALIILLAIVVMMTTRFVPASVAALLAAFAMVLNRVVTMDQARRSMAWQTLILVAGMISFSAAITKTGTAKMLYLAVAVFLVPVF